MVTSLERANFFFRTSRRPKPIARSAFAGFCFPSDLIVLAVRWYLRFSLSYRDVEELLPDRGIEVDHVAVYGGCFTSPACWPRLPGPADMPLATVGRSTRPRGEGRRPVALCLPRR